MTSIDEQLRDFRAFARVHSPAIDEELATGRCIFTHLSDSSNTDPDDHIVLANIYEIVCLRPLQYEQPSDPCNIEILSVWLTKASAIAFSSVAWSDGVAFEFATKLQREHDGLLSFIHSFPYVGTVSHQASFTSP